MNNGRFHLVAASCLAGLAAVGAAGCTQPGPIASHRATVGSLKASVSQLEYSNDNLKKQVADLKSESTRMENELVQANGENNELIARLDDAKDVIRKQGGDVTALGRSPSSRASTASADSEVPPELKSAVRRSRSRRKPPAAAIPRPDPATARDPGALELPVDPGPQAARDADDGRWLPVARGRTRAGTIELR